MVDAYFNKEPLKYIPITVLEDIKAEIKAEMQRMKHEVDVDEWYSGKFSGLGNALELINKKMEESGE